MFLLRGIYRFLASPRDFQPVRFYRGPRKRLVVYALSGVSALAICGVVSSFLIRVARGAGPLQFFSRPAGFATAESPSISLNGGNPLEQECGDSFEDPGATALDSRGQAISIKVSGTVDTRSLGSYMLTYTAVEGRASVSVERTVLVIDNSPPTIALEGSNPMTLTCGQAYEEPGSSAVDGCEGNVPVTTSGTIDPQIPGTYTVSYTASDKHNNTRTVTRTVIVGSEEDSPPTIKLNGHSALSVECGNDFVEPGATALTSCAGSVSVEASGQVDTRMPGDYTIIYTALFGELKTESTRNVTVVDTTPPVINLTGDNPLVLELNQTFTDPGATALDGCAGSFPATPSGTVDTKTAGSYVITYRAHDSSGNEAVEVRRTVRVMTNDRANNISLFLTSPGHLEAGISPAISERLARSKAFRFFFSTLL
jgi:hypothetical protein